MEYVIDYNRVKFKQPVWIIDCHKYIYDTESMPAEIIEDFLTLRNAYSKDCFWSNAFCSRKT